MDLGDVLPFRAATDEDGVPVAAQTAVLTVTLPDGTTATPTVTSPSTGQYKSDYQTTVASPSGLYLGKWLFTFSGGATTAFEESFDVGPSLVSVGAAISHLRAGGVITSDADLEQLQWLTMVATDAVERDLERVFTPRTIVETHDGGGSVILEKSPVLSITSVTEFGVTVTDVLPKLTAGILYRGSNYTPRAFGSGWQNVTVTYRAGYLNPPPVVRKVALNAIQGMWQSSQQAPMPFADDFADAAVAAATAGLTPIERSAYDSLRAAAIA